MSNPTTPFGWQMPENTDLVTDLPADFEVFGQAVATDLQYLLGGTTGQVLAKGSATDLDFDWVSPTAGDIEGVTAGIGISGGGTSGTVTVTNSMATAIDAKGDLVVGTGADAFSRLAVGTNGQVLTADSAEATGLKFATPAGGGKVLQVVNATTTTAVNITTTTQTDTGLTATITPTLNTSKILVLVNQTVAVERSAGNNTGVKQTLLRGATVIGGTSTSRALSVGDIVGASGVYFTGIIPYSILDAPATTSATTYKTQGSVPAGPGADTVNFQPASIVSSIVLLEIGA